MIHHNWCGVTGLSVDAVMPDAGCLMPEAGDRWYAQPMTMLDTLLLLALPASGKYELRRYLDTRSGEELAELHLRPSVQLDDYPYVHLQLCVDEALEQLGQPRVFHPPNAKPGQRNDPFFDDHQPGCGVGTAEPTPICAQL